MRSFWSMSCLIEVNISSVIPPTSSLIVIICQCHNIMAHSRIADHISDVGLHGIIK